MQQGMDSHVRCNPLTLSTMELASKPLESKQTHHLLEFPHHHCSFHLDIVLTFSNKVLWAGAHRLCTRHAMGSIKSEGKHFKINEFVISIVY